MAKDAQYVLGDNPQWVQVKPLGEEVGFAVQQGSTDPVPRPQSRKPFSILQRVLFRTSKQIEKLIQFHLFEALAGRAGAHKERIIGEGLVDRRSGDDTNDFPIGPLRTAEVKKQAADYDQNASASRL